MSGTLNKVMLIGNLGDEVKMHYFDDKNCVGRFPIATSETYVSKQTNERVTNTEWHNIVVRNKAAEICEKYLTKGDKVYIEGRIKTRKWTDDKGMERYSTEIQCDEFTFLTPKGDQQQSQQPKKTNTPNANPQPQQSAPTNVEPDGDDDLPF
ncbi:single-strand binding protein [Winogradskyella epiphytica]|uniref:Single-stranded DNA-binding protein n=1 Tax=Winogradskyella epiphytica TaxID=262005 RepID=A0A2V4WZG5_9FLAO|nr:single-stranded DNA-binding protein [Winogradskyella epiphytica]PYE83066.1 single-strand binding protein [Winogradskyella epiphytica]GGW55538.1 single-stranded DNA-binding protein [Winogradskyella epiphytica]